MRKAAVRAECLNHAGHGVIHNQHDDDDDHDDDDGDDDDDDDDGESDEGGTKESLPSEHRRR